MEIPADWLRQLLDIGVAGFVPYVIWRTERARKIMDKIFEEAKKTNARVTRLEQWQADHIRHSDREKVILDRDMSRLEDAVFKPKE